MIHHTIKGCICIVLTVSMLFCMVAFSAAAVEIRVGDVNADSFIDSVDALTVLRYNVGLDTLSEEQVRAGDVDADGDLNSTDAMQILQYVVGILKVFLADLDGEGRFYAGLDRAYGVNGADFEEGQEINDPYDAKEVIEKLGGDRAEADVDTYSLMPDGKLCYNPISKEAVRLGQHKKYQRAQKTTGTLSLGTTTLTYSVPTEVTAYDAVPIDYTVTTGQEFGPVHIEAVTFEEEERYPDKNGEYYDLTLPGTVNLDVTYEGYVAGYQQTDGPIWSRELTGDIQGTQYPNYDVDDLVRSGTLKQADYHWLKFSFVNTGDTILDSEGGGAFCWRPVLYQKNEAGGYTEIDITVNFKERIFDYLYPGEQAEMWLQFNTKKSFAPGEYRVVLNGEVRNEQFKNDWMANYVGGRTYLTASFDFEVTEEGAMSTPNEVEVKDNGMIPRNNWLGTYEEFMTSFHTRADALNQKVSGTLYVQPAPWNHQLVLKIMNGGRQELKTVRIPLKVESDSIQVNLNPYNEHYTLTDEGTRTPLIGTQAMADMRGNDQMGPDPRATIINDLKNMKEAGINYLTTTMGFAYTRRGDGAYAAFKFMMDAARAMGFQVEGYSSYPFNSQLALSNARQVSTVPIVGEENGYGLKGIDEANVIMADYSYRRYGDLYWKRADGTIPIGAEDTRGWMTIDHDDRLDMLSDRFMEGLQNFLRSGYGTVNAINRAYGSSYTSIEAIDPRTEGIFHEAMQGYGFTQNFNTTGAYSDWSRATIEMDLYRTMARAKSYRNVLNNTVVPNAKIFVAVESFGWLAGGIKPTTSNPHYRHIYYEQFRQALVPELLAASDTVYGVRNYDGMPCAPAEVYELTKQSTLSGFSTLKLAGVVHARDVAINTTYGTSKYVENYNLKNSSLKGVQIDTGFALFPYLKASYEGGGIPGVMWQDYYCDSFVTSTQYKELQFFQSKIEQMLQTEEGRQWAALGGEEAEEDPEILAIWSYPADYVKKAVEQTPRYNVFTDSVKSAK